MAKRSRMTHAVHMAHANILKGFDLARDRVADVPLGHEEVDPRTARKRRAEAEMEPGLDTHLHRLLQEMRGSTAAQMPYDMTPDSGGATLDQGE